MASVGGLSPYSSGSTSSLSGIGGLASGIDRDEIIKQLTSSIQSKIDKKNQQKTKLQWEQDLIRSITNKMYDFTQKYASFTSGSNLIGTGLFSGNDISVNGPYADFISVSGSTNASDLVEILGVKSLAKNASMTSSVNSSDRELSFGEILNNMDDTTDMNMVAGQKITIQYGNTNYTVTLQTEDADGNKLDYSTPEGVAKALNESLKKVSIGDKKTLDSVMSFKAEGDGKLTITNNDTAGNNIEIKSGTNDVLERLGFLKDGEKIGDLPDERKIIKNGQSLTAQETNKAMEPKSIAEQLGGQSISFSYNGKVEWIEMPSAEELKGKTMEDVKAHLQKQLDTAFGKGRVRVDLTKNPDGTKSSLSFVTTVPKTVNGEVVCGDEDTTSTLSVTSATGNLLGKESLLGAVAGESNRVNLNSSIKDSGLVGFSEGMFDGIPEGELLKINGVVIEGITADSSINDIINAINSNEKAGVKISYQENTDRFIINATQNGASGEIKLEGKMAQALFGTDSGGKLNANYVEGNDAVFAVKYPGSDEVTEIVRDSNTITIDGINITAKDVFGYDETTGQIKDPTISSTFTATVDAEKTSEIVKEMVDEFNEILKEVSSQLKKKPNRDYEPLTAEQKSQMSESEIKLWEEKAKEGILFADSDLRGLTDALRFAIPPELRQSLEKIGITTSTEYSDNGKLVFDKSKFESALKEDPNLVHELFAKKAETNEDGTQTKGGLITNMKSIMDKYASMSGSTKGILVERAGSEHSLLSTMDNSILDQMNSIDKEISKLMSQLSTAQDRYISQFTALETLVSQMNAQSGYLSSMFAQQG